MANLKVACHLITWKDQFQTGLEEARDLGYRACETFTHVALEYEGRVGELKDLLDEKGFKLSALYGGGRFGDESKRDQVIDYNEKVAKILAEYGADRIVFGPGGPRTEGGSTPEELKVAAETINEAAKRCFDLGVKACVHPHMYTEIQDRNELDFIMESTDPSFVFFCPDTAHLTKAGMDPVEVIRSYKDRVAYVHLKDVTPEDPDSESFPMVLERGDEALPIFCELGLGEVDLPGSLGALREIDYDGWVTVEIDVSTSTPKESLRLCRDYIVEHGLDLNNV